MKSTDTSSPAALEIDANRKPRRPVRSDGSRAVQDVAIIGFGTVGSSVAKILVEQKPAGLRLTHICNRNVERKKVEWVPSSVRWTDNVSDVLESNADIIVEMVGGVDAPLTWVRSALLAGKSVVTANKQLIAHHGPELLALAAEQHAQLLFGASVAGGVPVISGLEQGLAGDRLFKIFGILNGTCNYILSRIESTGAAFADALAEAQKLGFAEADPTDDVDGFDARAKLTILTRIGLRTQLRPADVLCKSIRPLQAIDFAYAKPLGCTIRQISWAALNSDSVYAAVQPAMVSITSPLARVQGSQNLVLATGEYGGETVFAGHGAGGNPTAVAVVSDLIAIARTHPNGDSAHVTSALRELSVISDVTARHYLRFTVKDRPGIIADIATILAKSRINIDSVLQLPGFDKSRLPFVITLEPCSSQLVESAVREIATLSFLSEPCLTMPIMD